MFPKTTFISIGVSPNGEGIVMQPVAFHGPHHRPSFSFVIAFERIDPRFIGTILLTGLRAYFPVINIFAERLIPEKAAPRSAIAPSDVSSDHSGDRREPHLCIYVLNDDESIVMRRFNNEDVCGNDPAPILLAPLMTVGPDVVADRIGMTLLAELAAMHPEVFAARPGLLRAAAGAAFPPDHAEARP